MSNRGAADNTREARDMRAMQHGLRRTQEQLCGAKRENYQSRQRVQDRDQVNESGNEVQINGIKKGGLGAYEHATNWTFY